MARFDFPSHIFPAPPQISLTAPDGWVAVEAPGAVIALAESGAAGQFATNVVVTVTRHSALFTLADETESLRREVAQWPESSTADPTAIKIGDRDYVAVDVAFRHPDAGTLGQLHVLGSFGAATGQDVVHLVGTYSAAQVDDAYRMLHAIIATLQVRPAPNS